MIQEATEADRQREVFVAKLKGRPYPKDVFGRAIQIGDVLIFGTGAQSAAGLNFGLVEKFNYKTEKRHPSNEEYERVSSVTVKCARVWGSNKPNLESRRGLASYDQACILDFPPESIVAVFEEWEASGKKG